MQTTFMSLKQKSIVLIAVCCLLVLAVSYAMHTLIEQDIRSGLATLYATEQVRANRSRVLNPLVSELALARKMASSRVVTDWIQDENNPQKRVAALAELESFRRAFADQSVFLAIHNSGHYYYTGKENNNGSDPLRYTLNPQLEEDRWFYYTLQQVPDYALNIDYDAKLQVTKVWINLVVQIDGKAVAVAGTGIDLSVFIDKVTKAVVPGVTSIFIEEGGAIQAHNQQHLIDFRTQSKEVTERTTIFQLITQAEDEARLRRTISGIKTQPERIEVLPLQIAGKNYLVGVGKVGEIGWYTLVLLDTTTLIGQRYFLPFALLLCAALVGLAVALGSLWNRYVINRIYRLDQRVQSFSRGEYVDFPPGDTQDEMSRLEQSFYTMARAQREHARTLEQKVASRTAQLAEKNAQLNQALSEIKTLSGLLPICMYCKEIRDDKGAWTQLEKYIVEHSDAEFSHGICEKCAVERFPGRKK